MAQAGLQLCSPASVTLVSLIPMWDNGGDFPRPQTLRLCHLGGLASTEQRRQPHRAAGRAGPDISPTPPRLCAADLSRALILTEIGSKRDPATLKLLLGNMEQLLLAKAHGYGLGFGELGSGVLAKLLAPTKGERAPACDRRDAHCTHTHLHAHT